jgi:phosphoribosyl 1,2-cyclic phosphate phosphodiesterase
MNIYFLGTGTSQGIPVIGSNHSVCHSTDFKDKRLRVSVWIHWDNYSYVIDCGPDFRQQMLVCNCQKVDGILYTHEHSDHTAGLDDIRPFFFKQGDIPIYGHQRVLDNLKLRFDYIFKTENKYPGAPSVKPFEVVNNHPFPIGNKTAEGIEIAKLKNLKVLVVNALREEPHNTHFNLQEALDFIALIKPEKTYLTHISHIMGFHEEVQQKLPKNVYLAYDNLEITI